jgi:LemA protein
MKTASPTGVVTILVAAVVLTLGGTCVTSASKLARLDRAVAVRWTHLVTAYQRRAALVPDLVATVQGESLVGREFASEVSEAYERVGRVVAVGQTAEQLRQYQRAEAQLGTAMWRLLVASEAYPLLVVRQRFRDLRNELELSENRISLERMWFDEASHDFNRARGRVPTSLLAHLMPGRFAQKPLFPEMGTADAE